METPFNGAIGKDQSANAEINFDCPQPGQPRLHFQTVRPAGFRGFSFWNPWKRPCATGEFTRAIPSKYSAALSRPQNLGFENLFQKLLPLLVL
jgi:hypothetical protein